VVGVPILVDLNVGELGWAFECHTVNVANEGSQRALDMLDSDLVESGFQLAKTAQPAIGPLSQIAMGLTRAILGANKNRSGRTNRHEPGRTRVTKLLIQRRSASLRNSRTQRHRSYGSFCHVAPYPLKGLFQQLLTTRLHGLAQPRA